MLYFRYGGVDMKKINFGYSNDNNPRGSSEGIGASPNLDIIDSEYIDFVRFDDNVYLISKVGMVFKGQENKVGTIDVREVIADMYVDGSGIIFANQEKSSVCRSLESSLANAKDFIEKGVSVQQICGGYRAPDSFKSLLNDGNSSLIEQPLHVVGIKPEIFQEKKRLLSNCRSSFSSMQRELEELYAKLDEYENSQRNRRSF